MRTIPMPGENEFVQNAFVKDGKCCLVGWALLADGVANPDPWRSGEGYKACYNPGPMLSEVNRLCAPLPATEWNNTHTGKECAALYRKAAKNLGYVVEDKPWRAK